MCPLSLERITQVSRCDRVLQVDFSIRVAPLAIIPSWVLASLDLETACPSRSCRLEVLRLQAIIPLIVVLPPETSADAA